MVSDLYVFDMETYVWERIPAYAEDDVPGARYFHSAEHCAFSLASLCRRTYTKASIP
jgi:hypothetical protein